MEALAPKPLGVNPETGVPMTIPIPSGFNEAFLAWFRSTTEGAWADYRPRSFEDYVARGIGGRDWQPGTRWVGGLSDADIDAAEARWSVHFPPDYRLFLRTLHTVDRPMLGAAYVDDKRMVPTKTPGFYDWRPGHEGPPRPFEGLLGAFGWLFEGTLFDIEHGLWLSSWGAKPPTLERRGQRLRELLVQAPKLIPIYEHRYLLAEPCQPGNPVLSVGQSDIIVYGSDLRDYLLWEFAALLLPNREDRLRILGHRIANRGAASYSGGPIPFWDELRDWRYYNWQRIPATPTST
jgi:hypothetical protein